MYRIVIEALLKDEAYFLMEELEFYRSDMDLNAKITLEPMPEKEEDATN